ncbi:MAG: hypothetical protein ACR2Q3_03505 [Woeseiaceae bacterium]
MSKRILVLGCYEHTLTIARSLARVGHQVILGVTPEQLDQGYVHRSRFVASTWQHPHIVDQPADFDAALLDYLEDNSNTDAIFPVGEDDIRRLACIRNRLPCDVTVVMPGNEAVHRCLNKESSNRLARACRVPTAGTRTVRTASELRQAIEELGLPAIAKPAESTSLLLKKKCVFVRTADELELLCRNWPATESDIIVQNEIAGIRHNCDLVAENGKIEVYFEAEILRTDQLDYAGNSVLDRSIPPTPLHREFCERMVAALNYTGLALFQFLRDPETGETCFLEVNPRSGAAISLAVGCGMNMPAAAVNACSNEALNVDDQYRFYQLRHCLHDDLQGLRKARVYQEIDSRQTLTWLGTICRDAIRADFFSTLALKDIRPTLRIYWNMLLRLLRTNDRRTPGEAITRPIEALDQDRLAIQSTSASGVFRQIDPTTEK